VSINPAIKPLNIVELVPIYHSTQGIKTKRKDLTECSEDSNFLKDN
jgi:hypothetical protein